MGERVAIVGTGLIGGSIGLALRAGGTAVTGVETSEDLARRAVAAGAADDATTDVSAACSSAGVVVVATPVGQIIGSVAEIARAAGPGTIVTDVGSTKGPIVAEAERLLGPDRPFVGGHPMAGSEREGIDAARADLFDGALWILTPTPHTDPVAFRQINGLVARLGARTLALDPSEHDRVVALVSHLPYALATTLMDLAGAEDDDRVFRAAAGSFRDITRTAGSSPHVWTDILAANRDALLEEIDGFLARLHMFREAVDRSDRAALDTIIERARTMRRRLPMKGEREPADPYVLEMPIPDRAGVLAEVTTALGELGVNIEDLWMDHHAGDAGVVHVVVDGRGPADRAAIHLRSRGYRPSVLPLEA